MKNVWLSTDADKNIMLNKKEYLINADIANSEIELRYIVNITLELKAECNGK